MAGMLAGFTGGSGRRSAPTPEPSHGTQPGLHRVTKMFEHAAILQRPPINENCHLLVGKWRSGGDLAERACGAYGAGVIRRIPMRPRRRMAEGCTRTAGNSSA